MRLDVFDDMRHSPIFNYITPGLTSWMIALRPGGGCVRMFEMERRQEMAITPHSHRFHFECIVLDGEVENTIWRPVADMWVNDNCDTFVRTRLFYKGKPGDYEAKREDGQFIYEPRTSVYKAGDRYKMTFDQIHSIRFSRKSRVLFFEGAHISNETTMIEPVQNGHIIRQGEVADWMFDRKQS